MSRRRIRWKTGIHRRSDPSYDFLFLEPIFRSILAISFRFPSPFCKKNSRIKKEGLSTFEQRRYLANIVEDEGSQDPSEINMFSSCRKKKNDSFEFRRSRNDFSIFRWEYALRYLGKTAKSAITKRINFSINERWRVEERGASRVFATLFAAPVNTHSLRGGSGRRGIVSLSIEDNR